MKPRTQIVIGACGLILTLGIAATYNVNYYGNFVGGTANLTALTVVSSNPNSSFGGGVVATNGFLMPTNPIPALTLTAGKAYGTNLSADIVLANFAGVPADLVWSIYLLCTNSSGSDWTVTFPSGCIGAGQGKPPVITVTNKQSAEFQINGWGQLVTNVNWSPHY